MRGTWKPVTAGVINIISGTFFLIGGLAVLGNMGQPIAASMASYVMYSIGLTGTASPSFVTMIMTILGTVLIGLGILSVLGGIFSVRRAIWGLALAGSISTFLSLLLPGVPAIILTALSKKEFT